MLWNKISTYCHVYLYLLDLSQFENLKSFFFSFVECEQHLYLKYLYFSLFYLNFHIIFFYLKITLLDLVMYFSWIINKTSKSCRVDLNFVISRNYRNTISYINPKVTWLGLIISIPWRSFAFDLYIRTLLKTLNRLALMDNYLSSLYFYCKVGFWYYRSWVFQSQGSKYPSASKSKWNVYQTMEHENFLKFFLWTNVSLHAYFHKTTHLVFEDNVWKFYVI